MQPDVENSQQLSWRLWGEEKMNDAVYTIYLKKVRYYRPLKSFSTDSDDDISHLEWETVRVKFIKAGTLEKLVECVTSEDGELESTYINIFFATYRSFASPKKVLSLMLDKYERLVNNELDLTEMVTEKIKRNVVVAIKIWIDSYPEDFKDPPLHALLHQLIFFAQHYLPDSELYSKAKHKLQKFTDDSETDSSKSINEDNIYLSTANDCAKDVYSFSNISVKRFAEQLTRIDMELFKRVVPHQCLGSVWSRRDKTRTTEAASVLATINQFNAVSFRVISTILVDTTHKMSDRAKLISKWIDIAQELRVLKNFSSLKAIISGLQSNPIYRLRKTWQQVARDRVELYNELARIFSEENNQWAQRDLLMREGTAKFADTAGENDKHMQKVIQKQKLNNSLNINHGTIPYLGTFLTDLTMIDTAIPDYQLDSGLLNFDKRRKEFEVLAQIKLLQGAASAYQIEEDELFSRWFDSLLVLDDNEAYSLSFQIEPPTENGLSPGLQPPARKISQKGGHKKNDSIASTSSGGSSSQFYCDISAESSPSPGDTMGQLSSCSSNSSILSLDVSLGGTSNYSSTITSPAKMSYFPSSDFYVIRVTVETDAVEKDGIVLYKSIMLSNMERTQQVIRNAINKLAIDGSPEEYTLSQILTDREMVLPPNANVYYALSTAHDLNFILRKKKNPLNGSTLSNASSKK